MLSRQVGRNIRWRRKKARLSLEELAYRASLDTSHIGKIERGCWNPNLQTLARIATALGISPRALFNCGTLDEPDYARLIAFACSTIPYYEFLSVYDPLFLGEFLGSFLMERITRKSTRLPNSIWRRSRMRLFPRPSHLRTAPTADMGSPPSIRENGTRSGFP